LIPALLEEFGCALDQTYFDVPRLRTSTSNDYLTSGISYAFHPHRDCWYSAPFCQVNWWIPVFEVVPENVMAFHPKYFDQPVRNGSARYDYAEWNRTSRQTAVQHIKNDTREQPKPEEPVELEPQVRVVPQPGGVMLFSGAQLHSTVPNTSGKTRFSIDFRTVHLDDVRNRNGSPNVDARCAGTTLRDFLRATDLVPVPEELARAYESEALALTGV
jgi:ectoine hydroxylase-related dioxygenase (phytanoyl-CoA dioxygenase family)